MATEGTDGMAYSLVGRTAGEIAAEVRAGSASPVEVVRAHLERIEALDGRVGAFQTVRAEKAVAEAEALAGRLDLADLPLAGVPIAIKDNVPVAGEPTHSGSAATSADPSPEDHEVVRRVRGAGAVVVGKTTVPELAIYAATDGPFGITRNPWDLSRTPGGSSGGSAAAVAAGMVPVAHGNDGLGSIRVPSACCGLVGIKPGTGVVPSEIGPHSWFGMTENGPIATTVADAALLLSVMAGSPDLAEVALPGRPLRIAVSAKPPAVGISVDREFAAGAREMGELLARAGHDVVERHPKYPTWAANAIFARWFAGPLADAEGLDRRRLQRRTRGHLRAGRLMLRLNRVKPEQRERWRRHAAAFFEGFDLLLTPGLARPPIPAIAWSERGWLANVVADSRYAPFAAPWNFAGWPAIVVPAGRHSSGMPLSVQFAARPGGEALLLSVARQVEEARPWPRHAPMAGE